MTPPLWQKVKNLLTKVKGESESANLKLNIQKTKIMASDPITSWEKRWGNNGNSDRLYFLGAQNHCRHLLLRRKAMTNLDSILQSRDITLVKAMDFPVVMYKCESWIIKKAKCQGIDVFQLVLEETLESPLD